MAGSLRRSVIKQPFPRQAEEPRVGGSDRAVVSDNNLFLALLPASLVGLAWGLVVVRMALKKKYIDFRLILVPKIPN